MEILLMETQLDVASNLSQLLHNRDKHSSDLLVGHHGGWLGKAFQLYSKSFGGFIIGGLDDFTKQLQGDFLILVGQTNTPERQNTTLVNTLTKS
jgi:hypothetical protein